MMGLEANVVNSLMAVASCMSSWFNKVMSLSASTRRDKL